MIDIPRLAFIEAQIIHRAARAGALKPFVRDVELQYKAEHGTLGTGVFLETRILGLLYFLILVPKELWGLDSSYQIYTRLENSFPMSDVTVTVDESRYSGQLYKFVHHLRNALGHVRFKFEAGSFEFWDWDPRAKVEPYRAIIQLPKLISFLEVVGSDLANYGSWPQTIEEKI